MVWKENTSTPQDIKFLLMHLDSNRTDRREATRTPLAMGSYTSLPPFTCALKRGTSLGIVSLSPHLYFLEVPPGASVSYES